MNKNKENSISIYDDLKQFYKKNKGHIYIYQDLNLAGKNEYEINIKKIYELKEYEKNRLSNELIEIIIDVLEDYNCINKLTKFINDNPVILYYDKYIRCLKSYLNCNQELRENFNEFIINLLTKSSCTEEAKLGIISSCVCKSDNLKEILEVFTIHNEYIFYVIKYLSYLGDNDKIFEICKNSYGYGKVFSVMNLNCINKEMRNWLLEKGCINNIAVSDLIDYCFLGGNLLKYFEENSYDKQQFENIMMYFDELISNYDIDEIENGINICLKIINLIENKFGGIYSLYTIVLIIDFIENSDFFETNREEKEFKDSYRKILYRCKDICNKTEWHEIIGKEFENIDTDGAVLINCAEKTNFKVKKKQFESVFNRNYKSPTLYRYAVTLGSPSIKKFLFYKGIKKLNMESILTGSDDINLDNITYDKVEQVCFFIIVNYLNYEDYSDIYKEINLNALRCPVIETRYKAINNLKMIKHLFNEQDINFIRELINYEIIKEIKMELIGFLPKIINNSIRYADITREIKLKPHVKDIYLKTINIVGTNYINMSEIEGTLFEEALVFLKREENNFYDENAIVVTTNQGYIIGYIPKTENFILKNLMDNNKYLYGYIKSINSDYDDIKIDLYLSYEDILEEITNTLSLLSSNYSDYLQ